MHLVNRMHAWPGHAQVRQATGKKVYVDDRKMGILKTLGFSPQQVEVGPALIFFSPFSPSRSGTWLLAWPPFTLPSTPHGMMLQCLHRRTLSPLTLRRPPSTPPAGASWVSCVCATSHAGHASTMTPFAHNLGPSNAFMRTRIHASRQAMNPCVLFAGRLAKPGQTRACMAGETWPYFRPNFTNMEEALQEFGAQEVGWGDREAKGHACLVARMCASTGVSACPQADALLPSPSAMLAGHWLCSHW